MRACLVPGRASDLGLAGFQLQPFVCAELNCRTMRLECGGYLHAVDFEIVAGNAA